MLKGSRSAAASRAAKTIDYMELMMMLLAELKNKNPKKNESGMTVVEAAIYLPIVVLAFLAFIVVSFYVTQRVVLDSAVSRVCVEAAAFLTDEPKIDTASPFTGVTENVYGNPYNTKSKVDYRSLKNESGFKKKIEEKVKKYAGFSLIEGRTGVSGVKVTSEFKNHVFFGELIINAEQEFKFPINFSLLGIPEGFKFKSTAKSMIVNADAFINDIEFVFDALRWMGIDAKNTIRGFSGSGIVGDAIKDTITNMAKNMLKSAIS
jgi:hypothetical protein